MLSSYLGVCDIVMCMVYGDRNGYLEEWMTFN